MIILEEYAVLIQIGIAVAYFLTLLVLWNQTKINERLLRTHLSNIRFTELSPPKEVDVNAFNIPFYIKNGGNSVGDYRYRVNVDPKGVKIYCKELEENPIQYEYALAGAGGDKIIMTLKMPDPLPSEVIISQSLEDTTAGITSKRLTTYQLSPAKDKYLRSSFNNK